LAISDLPQHAVTQERGIALAMARKDDNLLRHELSVASGLVGQVENLADVFERRGHRLDVLRPKHIVF
jgi:hypothetical protein